MVTMTDVGASDLNSLPVAGELDFTSNPGGELTSKITELVKGAGLAVTHKAARAGENVAALSDPADVFPRAMRAEQAFRKSISDGLNKPDEVLKSWSPEFRQRYGTFAANSPQNSQLSNWVGGLQSQLSDLLGKNISLTSPLTTGLVPFNLVAP